MEDKKTPTTPYISFKSFQNVLDKYINQDIPSHIDSSLFPSMSGATFSQLTGALRFFDLIKDNNETNKDLFKKLIDNDTRKATFKSMLEKHYKPLFNLDLKTTTPKVLKDTFNEKMNAPNSVQKNALNFFVHAAEYSGVEISINVVKGVRNLSSNSTRRRIPSKPKDSNEPESKQLKAKPEFNGDLIWVSIPLGINKEWKIGVFENYSEKDVKLFLSIAKSVLEQELESEIDVEDEEEI